MTRVFIFVILIGDHATPNILNGEHGDSEDAGIVILISEVPDWKEMNGLIDGRMTCDFTSFSTVFQSYQKDERLKMKGCVQ